MCNLRTLLLVAAVAGTFSHVSGQLLQLTQKSGGGERQPVVSADGKTVAYGAVVGGVRDVFTVGIDGGQPVQRTTGARVCFGWGTFESWPSLSISADGTRITYWTTGGVRILDIVATTDVLLATASQLPYPRVDPTGTRVVYQAPVNGEQEVFLVPAAGGTPQRLTTASGTGRRLPDLYGNTVVFQKPVQGFMELFAVDVVSGQARQLTKGSGPGNRYGRFTPDGKTIVYEAVTSGVKEVWRVDPVTGTSSQVSQLGRLGDRLPAMTGDEEVFFQGRVGTLEVHRADGKGQNLVVLTSNTSGGLRRPATDAHGHVIVFQATDATGINEVWRYRFCPEATVARYGTSGKPSLGSLTSQNGWYRCDFEMGLETALAQGTVGVFLFGLQQQNVAIPGAPGNFLYARESLVIPRQLDSAGAVSLRLLVPRSLKGSFYYQWLLVDPPANARGLVASEGSKVTF